ncbi:hypothetical protein HanIR_Chr12g0575041 [Helianthus annuus]|nr:hypothetical protein HanIR_Chr12g0575041 [Helianthus annuus]
MNRGYENVIGDLHYFTTLRFGIYIFSFQLFFVFPVDIIFVPCNCLTFWYHTFITNGLRSLLLTQQTLHQRRDGNHPLFRSILRSVSCLGYTNKKDDTTRSRKEKNDARNSTGEPAGNHDGTVLLLCFGIHSDYYLSSFLSCIPSLIKIQ